MANSGLQYYFNKAGLSTGDVACWFNFNSVGDLNSSIADSRLEVYGSTGSFWNTLGSGFFSGNYASIEDDNIDHSNFSSFLIYNKLKSGKAVLLSSLESGVSGVSGFILGVNDANKLQISCFDQENNYLLTNTSNISLSRCNGLFLSKTDNVFSISKFNFSDKTISEDVYTFPDTCDTDSNSILFGSGSWSPAGSSFGIFTGYLDELLIINRNIYKDSASEIFKSFYKNEPTSSIKIISENDSYSYSNVNTVNQVIWEEMQSGALDYISTNIFNKTGIGSIRVTSVGSVVSGTGYVAATLTGSVSLQTGYYVDVTGSGVTGYSSSGLIPTASGITGYVDVSLYPIAVFKSGDIYEIAGKSGVIGPTQSGSYFTDPLYGPIITQQLITGAPPSYTNLTFSYIITGLGGNCTYTHIADYSNNGSDNIVISHDLTYSSSVGTFRAFKNTQILYNMVFEEAGDDIDFIKQFNYDGVCFVSPMINGDLLDALYFSFSGDNKFNEEIPVNLTSGLFHYNGLNTGDADLILFQNGVFQYSKAFLTGDYSSGGYFLNNQLIISNDSIDRNDLGNIDELSGINSVRKFINLSGINGSGYLLSSGIGTGLNDSNSIVFINGLKLSRNIDYYYSGISGGSFITSNNNLSGVSGFCFILSPTGSGNITLTNSSGDKNFVTGNFGQSSSLLFYNRLRQKLNIDYLETCSLDLIYNFSGFIDNNEKLTILTQQ